ncbi:MAG: dihydropteroate synthase [Clostridia bacterium]|nr:dihydropteroate synthase [Clostridia bacterium]
MIIIGEKLNSSIKSVRESMLSGNEEFIASLAKAQTEAGAHWIDINAAMLPDEKASLVWLGEICRSVSELPLCIDTPDPEAAEYAIQKLGGKCMINSVTLQTERYQPMSSLAMEYGCPIVALCMDDGGAPETVEDRVRIATALANRLLDDGIAADDIFLDPMISPVGAVETAGCDALSVISELKRNLPVYITCGLSNISHGLPARAYINRAFLVAAMAAGMDSAIVDPLDKELMRLCKATSALLGDDEYCEDYIDSFRAGFFS